MRTLLAILSLPSLGWLSSCVENGISGPDSEVHPVLTASETFYQSAAPKVDILWVIDDTGSMGEEQADLGKAFKAFLEAVAEEQIAWQLGVTTTDVSNEATAGVLRGNPWVVTPETPDPAQAFSAAVQVGTSGASPEAGLDAAILAISAPLREGANRGFRRDDAILHIVVVSDDDDGSDSWLGSDPVGAFLEAIAAEEARTGQQVVFSAVAGDIPTGCHDQDGYAQAAIRYHEVVDALSGVFASICDADMSSIEASLGQQSVIYQTVFPLQAEAVVDSVTVSVNGARQGSGWSYQVEPSAVVFQEAPAPDSVILVHYDLFEPEVSSATYQTGGDT